MSPRPTQAELARRRRIVFRRRQRRRESALFAGGCLVAAIWILLVLTFWVLVGLALLKFVQS